MVTSGGTPPTTRLVPYTSTCVAGDEPFGVTALIVVCAEAADDIAAAIRPNRMVSRRDRLEIDIWGAPRDWTGSPTISGPARPYNRGLFDENFANLRGRE